MALPTTYSVDGESGLCREIRLEDIGPRLDALYAAAMEAYRVGYPAELHEVLFRIVADAEWTMGVWAGLMLDHDRNDTHG